MEKYDKIKKVIKLLVVSRFDKIFCLETPKFRVIRLFRSSSSSFPFLLHLLFWLFTGLSGPLSHLPSLSFIFWRYSSAFLTPNVFKSSFVLSVHLSLGRPLGVFAFRFRAVICPISPFDLHTCPAQYLFALFSWSQQCYLLCTVLLVLRSLFGSR